MERNLSFDTEELSSIAVRLGWAQLEMFADEVDKVQVMAAGDDSSVEDLRIAVKDGILTVEQPQYGLSLNIMESRWLQVCVRVPSQWKGDVALSTLSGLLSARKLCAGSLSLETVSGDLRAVRLTATDATLKTVGGDMRGEQLTAENLSVRSVSGDTALDALNVQSLKCTSVTGEQTYNMTSAFRKVDVTAVSGNVIITAPVEAMDVSLRSISGRVRTEGVNIREGEGVPSVRVTGVTADLKLISIKE